MLTPVKSTILCKFLSRSLSVGFQQARNCSKSSRTLDKMTSEPKWKAEKDRILGLPIEEKRKFYKCKEPVVLDRVIPWRIYLLKNKAAEERKHTLDDLNEFKKIKLDKEQSRLLSDKVSLYTGDITHLEVDAIVNAANSRLIAGGGVDGAIHRAAGPLLQQECNTLGGCPTGEAKVTGGYDLPAKYVIHTVGPQDGNAQKLQSCYENSFEQCRKYNFKSVAFPCISTGIYGFPNRLAAHIALRVSRQFLEKNKDVERIIFCTFMPVDIDVYETLMQMYFPVHDWNYAEHASATE